ncbi:SapC family protein [Methylobacterium terricola]|uniref:SapC family protein n=1 Tax=Methylobacterium terricola TaxID=2583531 RepID=A0A5C4L5H1_9HYPH|nr:SapC family protein [Methylobacterium terricola]TNC04651.1 SapC family protein [Methylobacterium terricola]
MSALPLFYRSVVPLDRDAHRAWHLAQPQRFAFARASHLVPALAEEIGAACRHLPVVFLPESLGPVPVFLVGAAPGHCALIDDQGTWTGRYLPAYLRRYPFILGESEGTEPLACIDAESDLLHRHGAAEPAEANAASLPLFTEDGQETPLLRERIRLVADYAEAARRTAAFGRLLQDLKLLRALTIQVQHPLSGESHTLHGALGVDEAALAALPEEAFARLRREGWLAMIYAHLVSLQAVADFLVPSLPAPAAPATLTDAA